MIPVDPTLEERIGIAFRRLVLIRVAANADPDDCCVDQDAILEGIIEAAEEAQSILEPIRKAGNLGDISEWTPKPKRKRDE